MGHTSSPTSRFSPEQDRAHPVLCRFPLIFAVPHPMKSGVFKQIPYIVLRVIGISNFPVTILQTALTLVNVGILYFRLFPYERIVPTIALTDLSHSVA